MSTKRNKPGVSSQVFKRNAAFAPQRAAGEEFGSASSAAKLILTSIESLIANIRVRATHGWVLKNMYEVLRTDPVNPKGQRKVEAGDLNLLHGLELNKMCSLYSVFSGRLSSTVSRIEGQIILSVSSFIPAQALSQPKGACFFKIVSAAVEADFYSQSSVQQTSESPFLPISNEPVGDMEFRHTVTPGSTLPLFLIAGIQFFDEVNGRFYPFKDKKYHPLTIVKVDKVI